MNETTIRVAVVKERGVEFVVVLSPMRVVQDPALTAESIALFQGHVFPGQTAVLVAYDAKGRAEARSQRQDLAAFVANTSADRLPWQKRRID